MCLYIALNPGTWIFESDSSQAAAASPANTPGLQFFHMIWFLYHIANLFGQFRPAALFLSSPSNLWPPGSLLAGQYEKLKAWNILGSVQHCAATSKTLVCSQHCCSPKANIKYHTRHYEENQTCPSWNQDRRQQFFSIAAQGRSENKEKGLWFFSLHVFCCFVFN